MKGCVLSKREIITKLQNYIEKKLKLFLKNTGAIQPNLAQSVFGWSGFTVKHIMYIQFLKEDKNIFSLVY